MSSYLRNTVNKSLIEMSNGFDDEPKNFSDATDENNINDQELREFSDFVHTNIHAKSEQAGSESISIEVFNTSGKDFNLIVAPGLVNTARPVVPIVAGGLNKVIMMGGGKMDVPSEIPYVAYDDVRGFGTLLSAQNLVMLNDGICWLDPSVTGGTQDAILAAKDANGNYVNKFVFCKVEAGKSLAMFQQFIHQNYSCIGDIMISVNDRAVLKDMTIKPVSPFKNLGSDPISLEQFMDTTQPQEKFIKFNLKSKLGKTVQFDDQSILEFSIPGNVLNKDFAYFKLRMTIERIYNPALARMAAIGGGNSRVKMKK